MTSSQEASLDRLWARAVKKRDKGKCRCCQSEKLPTGMVFKMAGIGLAKHTFEAAHIMPCRHHSTRWLLDNGLALCIRCHRYWTKAGQREWEKFVGMLIGKEPVQRLVQLSKQIAKYQDFEEIKGTLQAELVRAA